MPHKNKNLSKLSEMKGETLFCLLLIDLNERKLQLYEEYLYGNFIAQCRLSYSCL
jgi:hypothetical protein